MPRRKRKRTTPKRRRLHWPPAWLQRIDREVRRRTLRWVAFGALAFGVLLTGGIALGRLESYVDGKLVDQYGQAQISFVDLPESLADLALDDLRRAVAEVADRTWTDRSLCYDIAGRLRSVAWVSHVHQVRRTADARLLVSARYRGPVALVRQPAGYALIAEDGIRLPGLYRYDARWKLIQGVSRPAPPAGSLWTGDDVSGALDLIRLIDAEPFAQQVTGVVVGPSNVTLESGEEQFDVVTDRAGGRIRWGSAPGREVEENTAAQKLAILRENYRGTGRVDAHYPIIDVSTRRDRFTVPG